jgi:hypothetical protein
MAFVNVGVETPHNKSKRALREAIAADASKVIFYGTSVSSTYYGRVSDIKDGMTYQVVGPDPERSRKWYATVEKKNGKIRVS